MNKTPVPYTKDDFNWHEFKKHVPDEKYTITLLHIAVEELTKDNDEITQASQNQDWPRLEYLIDKLCDFSLYAEMKKLELLTRQIYQLLKTKKLEPIEDKLIELEKVIAVAIQALEQEITNKG